jgi:phosphoribosyl-ATP pyrophosphohydrolase
MTESSIVPRLMEVIADRKALPPGDRSYVAALMQGGAAKIVGKIAEEGCEVVGAQATADANPGGRARLAAEAADLVFHVLVLLGLCEVAWSDIKAELTRRFGISGIDEKESRSQGGR